MIAGELAGFAIVGVATQQTLGRTGRPRVDHGHTRSSHEVPDLGDHAGSIVKAVIESVDVDESFFFGCLAQFLGDQGDQLLFADGAGGGIVRRGLR